MTKINNYLDRKNSFILYNDWYEAIEELTIEEKGLLLDAIFKYHISKETPPKDSPIKMAFRFLRPMFDANIRSYEAKCEMLREQGKLGGRPTKEPNGFENNQMDKNKPDNVSVSDSVNENENVSESVNEQKSSLTHDFIFLLQNDLLKNETSNSSFVGNKNYTNKVFYFIDRNREKLEAKHDLADAKVYFRNFYRNDGNKEKGEQYERNMTEAEEIEVCKQIFAYVLKEGSLILEQKDLNENGLKIIIWNDRKKFIDDFKKYPHRIIEYLHNIHITDKQLEAINKPFDEKN